MSTKEEKKYKLSVYLAKKSFKKDADIITKIGDMGTYVVKDGKGELGVLYLQTGYPSVPKWADLFKSVLPKKELDLTTKSARAVLIANVKQRKFCLTFGHAHFLLNPLGIERNFGLKVALNMGGKSSLRSVDKTSLEVVQIQSKEQSSKEVGIASFDFDYETDILKSITAKNEEGTEDVIRAILAAPEQGFELRPGRKVLQSKISSGQPAKAFLIRVFVDIDRAPAEVVTAYRTSKIGKYWRENT
jgi:uncharacterized protein (TIGR04141 family)